MLSPYQDGFSDSEWQEALDTVATVKVRNVYLCFDYSSREKTRAEQTIREGMAKHTFVWFIDYG